MVLVLRVRTEGHPGAAVGDLDRRVVVVGRLHWHERMLARRMYPLDHYLLLGPGLVPKGQGGSHYHHCCE